MRIWIYGKDRHTVRALMPDKGSENRVIGTSIPPGPGAAFPLGGLTQAMYAAMQGELDLLLISDRRLLGDGPRQIGEISDAFGRYGVSARPASSFGSSSS